MIGQPFQETQSTVGINQLTCDIKHAMVGQGEWGQYAKPQKEFEAALAKILNNEKMNRNSDAVGADERTQEYSINQPPQGGSLDTTGPINDSNDMVTSMQTEKALLVPVAMDAVDEDMVMKCLADNVLTDSKLILSIFDYGGR